MTQWMRPELSEKNRYYVEKHRYYELKHFCMQYPLWKKEYLSMDDSLQSTRYTDIVARSNDYSDPTANLAERKLLYFNNMKLVEQAAMESDPDIYAYILKGVTEGLSYNYLKSKLEMPCGRGMYYDRYRRFFWLLDKTRY